MAQVVVGVSHRNIQTCTQILSSLLTISAKWTMILTTGTQPLLFLKHNHSEHIIDLSYDSYVSYAL